jgi:chaperone modulatory protein CbpM
MTDHLTEDEILAAIPGLTRTRLVAFIETEVVIPLRREDDTGEIRLRYPLDQCRHATPTRRRNA